MEQIISQEIILYVLVGIIAVLALVLIITLNIQVRLKKLVRSNPNYNLEQAMKAIDQELAATAKFQDETKVYLHSVEKRLRRSLQGLGNVHFSAFDGLHSGGNQSFAMALLNEHGDGVIISTLHARDRVNVFSKTVKKFQAELSLTDEEQQALTRAKESCKL